MHFLLQKTYWFWHRRSQRTQGGGCWHAGQWCKVSSDLLDWCIWDSIETRRIDHLLTDKLQEVLWTTLVLLSNLSQTLSLFAYLCYHSLHIPCMPRKNDFFRFLEQVGKAWSDLLRRFGYNYWPWDPNVVRGQSALMSNIICTFKSSVWKGSLFQCVHLGTFLPQMCSPLW